MPRISKHAYEAVGGHPALDFVNSVRRWTPAVGADDLASFADAVRFATTAGLLGGAEARALARAPDGDRELTRLRALRDAIHAIAAAIAAATRPPPAALSVLDRHLAEGARHARLVAAAANRIERKVAPSSAGPAALRYRVADAAAALFTGPDAARIKACPACGWVFLDASKNRSRRWCSMDTCGSADKARRYYRRLRSTPRGTSRSRSPA